MNKGRRDISYGRYKGFLTCSESTHAGYRHTGYDQNGKLIILTHSSAILYSVLDRVKSGQSIVQDRIID